jgi:formate dehydrogenase
MSIDRTGSDVTSLKAGESALLIVAWVAQAGPKQASRWDVERSRHHTIIGPPIPPFHRMMSGRGTTTKSTRVEITRGEAEAMAKVLCVLYDDPVSGYPPSYARDSIPTIDHYPGGQTTPTPKGIDFTPGELLGSVSGELGLRPFLEGLGHTLVVTSDKEGEGSVFDRELPDAEVVISQPFWPAYLTAERMAKAKKLKLAITAGIGSDHYDLQAAIQHGVTVTEVTYSNSISVSEHAVMLILSLVRDYLPSYQWVVKGGWNIADSVSRAYDLEGMEVGVVAAGRIGTAVLRRLKPFDVKLHYTDRHRLPADVEKELGVTYHPDVKSMVPVCDVVSIHVPLHPETEHLFDDALIGTMKRGAYLVNTARAKICDRDAIVRALESGRLAGYAGDVWFPQPPPPDHPWRTMPHHGMTPHTSGTSLSAQARYAAGTREILECWFEGRPIREEYVIVDGGKLAGVGAHSYSVGKTAGSA